MGKTRPIEPAIVKYFAEPSQPTHRQYLALRSFFLNGRNAEEVAKEFGYTANTIYTLARDFRGRLPGCAERGEDPFFYALRPGRANTIVPTTPLVFLWTAPVMIRITKSPIHAKPTMTEKTAERRNWPTTRPSAV